MTPSKEHSSFLFVEFLCDRIRKEEGINLNPFKAYKALEEGIKK